MRAVTMRLLAAVVILGSGVACGDPPHDRPQPAIGPLPGAEAFNPKLQAGLVTALAAKGAGYHPHTRHLRSDGTPRYTNRLILESSPYLLQHAHNPIR
jgi:hypothetical protein